MTTAPIPLSRERMRELGLTVRGARLEAADRRARTRGRPRELELVEQVQLFNWARARELVVPELRLLHAIPNGGGRSKAEAGKLKASGVRRGVSDVCLPVARGACHGLYLELKSPQAEKHKQKPSVEQQAWIDAVRAEGYRAECVVGWEAAVQVLSQYLGLSEARR